MTSTSTAPAAAGHATSHAGWQVVGVVPALAVPPAGVRLVRHREVAALVAPQSPDTRQCLLTHTEVLDRAAGTTAVLPVRFGTVAPSLAAVARQVLEPHHDDLVAALAPLAGRVQYLLRARYLPDVAVGEVVAEDPRVRRGHRVRHRRNHTHPGADRAAHHGEHAARMRLGEMVARAVTARRERDTGTMVDTLAPYAAGTLVRPARSLDTETIADVAFLVDLAPRGAFESAVEELGRRWHGRVRLRLLGPMAAYHFAGELVAAEAR